MYMIRSFVAVNLTPEIKEKIGEAEREFDIKGIKTVDPALVHVTMKFLGSIDESRIGDIEAALKNVKVAPFDAKIRGIGCFPGEKNPRVIWIGAEGGIGAEGDFVEMNRQVEDLLEPLGFPKEGRFKSHVTIGRVKFPSPEQKQRIPELIKKYRSFDAGSMRVESMHIMKSTLSPKGPSYEALKEIKL